MRRCALFLILALLGSRLPALAEVQVRGALDHTTVGVGESTILTITVEGAGSVAGDPKFETPEGLRIRSAGESRNYSLVNGRLSQSVEIRYAVTVLREGQFKIGPIELAISGRAYTVGPFQLSAAPDRRAPGGPGTPSTPGTQQRGEPPGRAGASGPPAVFVEMDAEPREVYVGQQLILRVGFWQRGDLSVLDASYIPPETEGFWKEQLPPERRSLQARGGTTYEVSEILTALFPTRAGELVITPARVAVRYREPGRRQRDSFFPFGFSGRELEAEPASGTCTVRVKPLPKPASAGFTGAVGEFRIVASVDREEVVQGEPVTWTVRISGEGNVSSVEGPVFPEIPGCRGFDAGSEVQTKRQDDTMGGAKSFSRVLIPEAAGSVDLPALEWSYFHPKRHQYVSETTVAQRIRVLPAAGGAGDPSAAGRLGGAIRGIRGQTRLVRLSSERPWRSGSFWLLQMVPLMALVVGFGWKLRREEQEKDPGRVRMRNAPRRLRATLQEVEKDPRDPWGRLARGLESFLADRYGPEVHGMTREALQVHLVTLGAEATAAARVSELLARADAQRYAPAEPERSELSQAVREAADAASRLAKGGHRG